MSNGKLDVGSLDLCRAHYIKLMRLLQPRQRKQAGVTHQGSRKRAKARSNSERENLKKAVRLLVDKEEMSPKEMAEHLKVKTWQLHDILPGMVKTGEIAKVGRGRGVRYRRK